MIRKRLGLPPPKRAERLRIVPAIGDLIGIWQRVGMPHKVQFDAAMPHAHEWIRLLRLVVAWRGALHVVSQNW
jgi:hypothetical protein